MNARPKPDKPHRQPAEFPALSPDGQSFSLPPWNQRQNRLQTGRLANGGCLCGGQTTGLWGPQRDLLHITHGPVGCGVYAHARRSQPGGPMGIDVLSGLNLGTDVQERDIVFGGHDKLARAVTEADRLFPLRQGTTILSTCPVALIGDDLDGVARRQSAALAQPVVAVHCAGFRQGDGVGETHATVTGTWHACAVPQSRPSPYDVVLICLEMDGAWRNIVRLLEALGLNVVARWPAGGSRAETSHLGHGRLAVGVDMNYWVRQVQRQFGTPSIDADFLGPTATAESLRAIAAHFDDRVRGRAEDMIEHESHRAAAILEQARARLAGKLFFSFAPLDPAGLRALADVGIRAGSALQGARPPRALGLTGVHRALPRAVVGAGGEPACSGQPGSGGRPRPGPVGPAQTRLQYRGRGQQAGTDARGHWLRRCGAPRQDPARVVRSTPGQVAARSLGDASVRCATRRV